MSFCLRRKKNDVLTSSRLCTGFSAAPLGTWSTPSTAASASAPAVAVVAQDQNAEPPGHAEHHDC